MEPIQYEDLHKEPDEGLVFNTGRSKRAIQIGLILVVFLTGLLFLVKIPRSKKLRFELKGGIKETVVQFAHPVIIHERYTKNGQQILPNGRLVGLKSSFILELLDAWQRAVKKLEYHDYFTTPVNRLKIENQTAFLEKLESRLNFLDKLIEERTDNAREIEEVTSKTLVEERKSFERQRMLQIQDVVSEASLERTYARLLNAKQDSLKLTLSNAQVLENLNRQLVELQTEILRLNQEINSIKLSDSLLREELSFEIKRHEQTIKRNFGHVEIAEDHLILLSEGKGIISLINESESIIPFGESVLRIKEETEPFYAYAEVNSAVLAELVPESRVYLEFDGYPQYMFGTQQAIIGSVSLTANEKGFYQVLMNFNLSDAFRERLYKGMTGNASIETRKLSIIGYLMNRLTISD